MPTKRQLDIYASFVSFRLPGQKLRRIAKGDDEEPRSFTRRISTSSIVPKPERLIDPGPDIGWTYEGLLRHASATLANVNRAFARLQALQKDKIVVKHIFREEFKNVTDYIDTVKTLISLALALPPEEVKDEVEEPEEDQVAPRQPSESVEPEPEFDFYLDDPDNLATDPNFASWTSVQMLLHVAELRYQAWLIRNGGDIDEDEEVYKARNLEKEAKAYDREAKDWEVEGNRRRGLEDSGMRKAWDWGLTTKGGVVQEPRLEFEEGMRRWDWKLNPVEGKPYLGGEVPTLGESWEGDGEVYGVDVKKDEEKSKQVRRGRRRDTQKRDDDYQE